MKKQTIAFHFQCVLLGLLLFHTSAFALEEIVIYRWRSGVPIQAAGHARKYTFGLNQEQMNALTTLTEGEVDFSHLYGLPAKKADAFRYSGRLDRFATGAPPPGFTGAADPRLADEWWIKQLRVKEAWKIATGRGVTVADCDAGYYVSERDLAGNLLMQHRYSMTNKKEPLNVSGGYFVYHGTAVAAITSGVLDGYGTNGIAFDARFVPLQNYAYDSSIDGDADKEEATAQCILRAMQIPDVKIIVLENQTSGSSETFTGTRAAVRLAQKAGITIVSAAGNSSNELKAEEADDTGSIIVGAIDPRDQQESFSNYGKRVAIAAYGEDLSTLYGPDGKFGKFSGTSGATPQVAATVALMLEANSKLLPSQVKAILEQTRVTNGANAKVGGKLDAFEAVNRAQNATANQNDLERARVLRASAIRILKNIGN